MMSDRRLWFFSQMVLQENVRWKALDEIYNIYRLLHRSDLNIISENVRQTFSHFRQKNSSIFGQTLMKFCRNVADILENVEIFPMVSIF